MIGFWSDCEIQYSRYPVLAGDKDVYIIDRINLYHPTPNYVQPKYEE